MSVLFISPVDALATVFSSSSVFACPVSAVRSRDTEFVSSCSSTSLVYVPLVITGIKNTNIKAVFLQHAVEYFWWQFFPGWQHHGIKHSR
jgi:hypothetical protein